MSLWRVERGKGNSCSLFLLLFLFVLCLGDGHIFMNVGRKTTFFILMNSIIHSVNNIQLQRVSWILTRFEFCLVIQPVSRAASQLINMSLNIFLDLKKQNKKEKKYDHVSL